MHDINWRLLAFCSVLIFHNNVQTQPSQLVFFLCSLSRSTFKLSSGSLPLLCAASSFPFCSGLFSLSYLSPPHLLIFPAWQRETNHCCKSFFITSFILGAEKCGRTAVSMSAIFQIIIQTSFKLNILRKQHM